METKRCMGCDDVLLLSRFSKNKRTKDGLQTQCKACSSKHCAKWYINNVDVQIACNANRKLFLTTKIYEYLLKHPCVVCGESDPLVLEFDHIKRSNKKTEISEMLMRGYRWEKLLAEIKKCQVMCANCHRRKTAKDGNFTRFIIFLRLQEEDAIRASKLRNDL